MVRTIERIGEHVHVHVESGGEAWIAKITHRALESLGLNPGSTVYLVIKAHAIQPCS